MLHATRTHKHINKAADVTYPVLPVGLRHELSFAIAFCGTYTGAIHSSQHVCDPLASSIAM